ncbi:MAG: exonuclease SbcCD subunit D [Oscillospiraceae bacterium]|nr:exonuclease SbcCD subunit D [Oscillospiraceae bacterium]
MKLLHLGDLHIGKIIYKFSMIPDQRHVLEQVKNIAVENNVDVVMISGDVYDKNTPSVEAVKLFDEFLTDLVKLNLKVLIISGNHDSAERLSFASSLIEASDVYISKQLTGDVKKVTFDDEHGNVNFYLLPFIRPIDVRSIYPDEKITDYNQAVAKVVSEMNIDKSQRNVILSHQFITNAKVSDSELLSVGGLDNVEADIYKDFDYAALGHIHSPQKMAENIRYSGSILKYSFSESRYDKSVPIIDIKEKGSVDVSLVPLVPLHDMIEIEGEYNDIMSPDFYKNIDTESYVRVILTNDTAEPDAMNKLRIIYKNIMHVDYNNITKNHVTVLKEIDESVQKSPVEFVKNFYEEMYGKSMCEQQEKYLADTIEEIWR